MRRSIDAAWVSKFETSMWQPDPSASVIASAPRLASAATPPHW